VKPVSSGYADVNGIKLYHEIYGKGDPVVLIHGGLMLEFDTSPLIFNARHAHFCGPPRMSDFIVSATRRRPGE